MQIVIFFFDTSFIFRLINHTPDANIYTYGYKNPTKLFDHMMNVSFSGSYIGTLIFTEQTFMAGASETVGPCLKADPSMPRVSAKLNVIQRKAFKLVSNCLLRVIWTNLAGSVSLDARIRSSVINAGS